MDEVKKPDEQQAVETTEVKEDDLVVRASQLKDETQTKDELDKKFNINELDAHIEQIKDENLKTQMLGLKKSLLKGENQKYQEIADLRKQYEQALAQTTTWTPERIKAEMAKPDFIQAAQSIVGQQSQESNDSMLSEAERRKIEQAEQKVNSLMQNYQQLLREREDTVLKQRYANYDPTVVDKAIADVAAGKIQLTREDIWKAIDYANGIKRAYKLREQDLQKENKEKLSAMTIDSTTNVTQPERVVKDKKESTEDFIRRSYLKHSKK